MFASAWARSELYLRFSWIIIDMPGAISVGLRAQGHHPSWSFWKSLNVFSLASGQRCCVLHVFFLVLLVNDSEYSQSTGAKPAVDKKTSFSADPHLNLLEYCHLLAKHVALSSESFNNGEPLAQAFSLLSP
jgi:hypothetical protein